MFPGTRFHRQRLRPLQPAGRDLVSCRLPQERGRGMRYIRPGNQRHHARACLNADTLVLAHQSRDVVGPEAAAQDSDLEARGPDALVGGIQVSGHRNHRALGGDTGNISKMPQPEVLAAST